MGSSLKNPTLYGTSSLTSQSSKWEVEVKSDNSPLTKADRVANQVRVLDGRGGIPYPSAEDTEGNAVEQAG